MFSSSDETGNLSCSLAISTLCVSHTARGKTDALLAVKNVRALAVKNEDSLFAVKMRIVRCSP
jgi:hypothetical protein